MTIDYTARRIRPLFLHPRRNRKGALKRLRLLYGLVSAERSLTLQIVREKMRMRHQLSLKRTMDLVA